MQQNKDWLLSTAKFNYFLSNSELRKRILQTVIADFEYAKTIRPFVFIGSQLAREVFEACNRATQGWSTKSSAQGIFGEILGSEVDFKSFMFDYVFSRNVYALSCLALFPAVSWVKFDPYWILKWRIENNVCY